MDWKPYITTDPQFKRVPCASEERGCQYLTFRIISPRRDSDKEFSNSIRHWLSIFSGYRLRCRLAKGIVQSPPNREDACPVQVRSCSIRG
jgi:hypothetical protein